MQNLQSELVELLKHEDNLVVDGHLNKNKIIELALKVEPQLIVLLIKNPTFKKHFFQEVEDVLVFDKIKFQRFVNNKSFLPDSYTAFKNKIGLTINDDSLDNFISTSNDVVLAWPHKDCVLEGGQTKEDQKRNEIFWNETLAPDSVDRLLDAKTFSNFKKFDKDGEHKVTELKGDENLIIKGNNLLALASLLKTHRGKIKLIYIDPPYNTGGDGFNYNDSFNHSSWLSFMKNRLVIARKLLTEDGVIFVQCDDNEQAYLKVLMDEIFHRNNFISSVVWQRSYSPINLKKHFSDNHDTIHCYAKKKESLHNFSIKRDEKATSRYKNLDNDPRGVWTSGDVSVGPAIQSNIYPIISPQGNEVLPPKGYSWRFSQTKFNELVADNRIYFPSGGNSVPRYKRFLSEVKDGVVPMSLWTHKEVGHTQDAKREIKTLFDGESVFDSPKPEKLISRFIELATKENDIVLDFHLGSGTTSAIAHKMKRRYIGIEQMDYIETVAIERLKKVINGEQGGISKDVDWQGGGSFVYAELMQYNQKYIDLIQDASTKEKLINVWNEMQDTAFLSYQFDKKSFNERLDAFKTAPIEEMKRYLVEILDKNQLYVNYSEIEDATFNVSEEDKKLNKQFYSKK
jgi:adenine-specific DNA-methyltransferase